MLYQSRTFTDETVSLDGNEFIACTFTRCELVFSGGIPPKIVRSKHINSRFAFDKSAANTISFLVLLHVIGHRKFVDEVFDRIRGIVPPSDIFH